MTQAPRPGSETVRLHFVYDAWNRLVAVWQDDGDGVLEKEGSPPPDTLIATYRYDATGRRICKLLGADLEEPTLTLDYYHNNAGQIIEVHKDGDDDHPLEQYIWSPRYVHAPILRWRDENTDGENLETLYYCNDANFNVTALVDTAGAVVERYLYDPYGKVTFLKADWSLQEVEGHADGTASAYANELLFTGHRLDPESGLYITLHRHYHPTLGRWMQRDPKGYVDGMSLYLYCGACPLSRLDAMGLEEKSLFGVIWDDFRSMWSSKESPTQRRQRLKREFDAAAPEPLILIKIDPEASKVTQMQEKIAAVPVVGNLTSAYNEHAYRHDDAAAQEYLWRAAADACAMAGSAAGGAAAGVTTTTKMAAARSAAASKTASAAPAEAAEVQAATKTVSTPKSPADMPVDLRGATKPPGAPAEGPPALKGAPKPSPKFQTPTNAPQLPPEKIPAGMRVRQMPPTEQYPNGYWRLEKPMKDGSWQGIDPSTMKPGTQAQTHVPLPPSGGQ
jgi:RHS repeat-associated protein